MLFRSKDSSVPTSLNASFFLEKMAQVESSLRHVTWGDRGVAAAMDRGVPVSFEVCEQMLNEFKHERAVARSFGFRKIRNWTELRFETQESAVNWARARNPSWGPANFPRLRDWADSIVPPLTTFRGCHTVRGVARGFLKDSPFTLAMGSELTSLPHGDIYDFALRALLLGLVPCGVWLNDEGWTVPLAVSSPA